MKQVFFAVMLFVAVVSPGLSGHRISIWNDTSESAKFSIKAYRLTKFGKFVNNLSFKGVDALAKEFLDKEGLHHGAPTAKRSLVLDTGEKGSFDEDIAILELTYPKKRKISFIYDGSKVDRADRWYRFYNKKGKLTLCELSKNNYKNKKRSCVKS